MSCAGCRAGSDCKRRRHVSSIERRRDFDARGQFRSDGFWWNGASRDCQRN